MQHVDISMMLFYEEISFFFAIDVAIVARDDDTMTTEMCLSHPEVFW